MANHNGNATPLETTTRSPLRKLRRWGWVLAAASAVIILGVFLSAQALTDTSRPRTAVNLPEGVGIDPQLGETVPLDLQFRDEQGNEVRLAELVDDKPVLLSIVYYKCPMLCNMVMDGVIRSLRALDFDVGREFNVLTISFDPRETPELAASGKQTALERYGRAGDHVGQGWRFLTGDLQSIEKLTEAVGFHYSYDEKTGQYAHGAGVFVLTKEGQINRFFNGVDYAPRDLRLALVETSDKSIGSAGDQVLLLCFQYDPARGRYGLAIIRLIRLAGTTTVIVIAGAILFMLRRERQKRGAELPAAAQKTLQLQAVSDNSEES